MSRIQQSPNPTEILFSIDFLTAVSDCCPDQLSVQTVQCLPGLLFPRLIDPSETIHASVLRLCKSVLLSQRALGRVFVFSILFTRCKDLIQPHLNSMQFRKTVEESNRIANSAMEVIAIICETCPEEMRSFTDPCLLKMVQIVGQLHSSDRPLFFRTVCSIVALGGASETMVAQNLSLPSLPSIVDCRS